MAAPLGEDRSQQNASHKSSKWLANKTQVIALGALGVSGAIWALDGVTDVLGDWMPAIVLGLQAANLPTGRIISRKPVTIAGVKSAIIEAETVVNQVALQLQELSVDEPDRQQSNHQAEALRSQLHEILAALKRDHLKFAILGSKGVGKTTLHEWLGVHWLQDDRLKDLSHKVQITDTRSILTTADDADTLAIGKSADLVIFVVMGDLLDSEFKILQQLNAAYRRSVIVLNKQDQYLPKEQIELLAKIRDRVSGMIVADDVIAIASQPRPIKVRQYQNDGSTKEWLEEPEPQVDELTQRLQIILLNDAQKLIIASSLGDAEALKVKAKAQLNEKRRTRALPMIERSQWVVAGTAFATPFPAIDLLATAAINGQMVADLSNLYQQKFSLEQAKTITKTLSELMIKLGIVEISTQAIGAVLKTNALTYVAGGAVQGVSGAYLTRIAGLALIEYWESDDRLPSNTAPAIQRDRLQTILKSVFQQNRRSVFLQGFVTQAFDRMTSRASSQNLDAQNLEIQNLETIALPEAKTQDLQIRAKLPTLESQSTGPEPEPELESAELDLIENFETLPR
jgi:uncharacterized protein (DUF697 family)